MSKAEQPSKTVTARKRNRKRKRRVASSSSSSNGSSSSDSSSDGEVTLEVKKSITTEDISSESSSSESESESDRGLQSVDPGPTQKSQQQQVDLTSKKSPRRLPSVSPPPAPIPSFLPFENSTSQASQPDESQLKDRFRKFWMASVADGFKDDLEQIRKEPGLTKSRLAMLIDSLASGADVFTSSTTQENDVNEMEMVLDD